jgi:phospholipid transport system substrate-binding protein
MDVQDLGRRRFLAGLAGVMLAGSALSPAWALSGPEGYVDGIAADVMQLANGGTRGETLKGQFADLLNRYINLHNIANFALGPWQKQLPAGDRAMFYTLVSRYAAALFVYYIDDFKGSSLEIKSTSQQGQFITIQSAIKLKGGGREQVQWRVTGRDGGYRVADVNLKGVWLTIAMKQRFKDVLTRSRGDFQALYEELRKAETW